MSLHLIVVGVLERLLLFFGGPGEGFDESHICSVKSSLMWIK